ncbi:MAG: TetR/AcrR family transcriptional regulator [Anaerolineaceae bacterium]|nr:TetR/AcrR family transcriptional regulator [Anaerolineaceae bacterium]
MARPREFEPNEALNQAMFLFWQKGYEETAMADLVAATGVSRYGFYSEFGDKHDLFLKCIDHYASTAIETILSPLESGTAALPEIRAYFDQLLTGVQSGQPPVGCLIGNTAFSAVAGDTAVASRVGHHYGRMRAAFLNALQNAVQQGQLAANENPEILADYLLGVAVGYLACIRSLEAAAVQRYIEVALARLS